jgi:hypothetical protein
MKTLALSLALGLLGAGCLGNFVPAEPGPQSGGDDMAHAAGSGTGNGTGAGNGTGGGGATSSDMAMTAADGGGGDGGTAPVGTAAFGATCTVNGDCQSAMCEQFVQGTVHRCTKPCTVATQTTDCPAPPSAGTCTNAVPAYCKFTQ